MRHGSEKPQALPASCARSTLASFPEGESSVASRGAGYELHGRGCRVSARGMVVDFDLASDGTVTGVDPWKLHNFARSREPTYAPLPDVSSLAEALDDLVRAGLLVRDGAQGLFTCAEAHYGERQSKSYGKDGFSMIGRDLGHFEVAGLGRGDPCHDWGRPPGDRPSTAADRGVSRAPSEDEAPLTHRPGVPAESARCCP